MIQVTWFLLYQKKIDVNIFLKYLRMLFLVGVLVLLGVWDSLLLFTLLLSKDGEVFIG